MPEKAVYVNGRYVGYAKTDDDTIDVWGRYANLPTVDEIADEIERRTEEREKKREEERRRASRTVDYDEQGNLNISHEILQGRDIFSIRFLRETEYECSGKAFEGRDEHGRPIYSYPFSSTQGNDVAYAIKKDMSVIETTPEKAMSLCKKGEAVIWTDNLNDAAMPRYRGIEGLKRLAKEIIRDEKYAKASRVGKLAMALGQFAEDFFNANSHDE